MKELMEQAQALAEKISAFKGGENDGPFLHNAAAAVRHGAAILEGRLRAVGADKVSDKVSDKVKNS